MLNLKQIYFRNKFKFGKLKDIRERIKCLHNGIQIFSTPFSFLYIKAAPIFFCLSTAMVSRLDQSVGCVISALEEANMLKNSIVIFQSDNGGPSVGLFANSASNWPFKGVWT